MGSNTKGPAASGPSPEECAAADVGDERARLEEQIEQSEARFRIEGTPCESVFEDKRVVVPHDVQSRFPKDTWLRQHEMQSYVAIAFYDIGANPLGHMGIMHDAPLESTGVIEAALRVFGCHAAAETVETDECAGSVDLRPIGASVTG